MFESMKIRYFLIFGLIFTVSIFIGSFFIFGPGVFEEDHYSLVLYYGTLGIFPSIWFILQLKKQDKTISDIMSLERVARAIPSILILVFTLIFFSIGAFWLTSYTLSSIFPTFVELLLQEELFPEKGIPFLLFALYVSIFGPIIEEFIFRGLLLKRLAAKVNIVFSIFVTNIIFAIFHVDILGAFTFGFILSLLYLKSGNLLIPILIHALNNTAVTMLVILDPPVPDFMNYTSIDDLAGVMFPHIIILIITIPVLLFYIKTNTYVLKRSYHHVHQTKNK